MNDQQTPASGKFIVLEGCEGAGKTTQIQRLKEKFPEALFVREIGGTPYAEKGPRHLVLTSEFASDLNGYEQMTQAFSGRSHHLRKVIAPALEAGKTVFCDRYDASSFAYQIFGMEAPHLFGLFDALKASLEPMRLPDLYVILDVSPEVGMARTKKRAEAKGESNYFDKRGIEFHARVREGYKRFAELMSARCKVIDAAKSEEEVWKDLQEAIQPAFK